MGYYGLTSLNPFNLFELTLLIEADKKTRPPKGFQHAFACLSNKARISLSASFATTFRLPLNLKLLT